MVSGIHRNIVKSDIAPVRPQSLLPGVSLDPWMTLLRSGRKGICGRGEAARALNGKVAPAEGGQVGHLVRTTLPEKLDKCLSILPL